MIPCHKCSCTGIYIGYRPVVDGCYPATVEEACSACKGKGWLEEDSNEARFQKLEDEIRRLKRCS